MAVMAVMALAGCATSDMRSVCSDGWMMDAKSASYVVTLSGEERDSLMSALPQTRQYVCAHRYGDETLVVTRIGEEAFVAMFETATRKMREEQLIV